VTVALGGIVCSRVAAKVAAVADESIRCDEADAVGDVDSVLIALAEFGIRRTSEAAIELEG
jgi:hypothetical protein